MQLIYQKLRYRENTETKIIYQKARYQGNCGKQTEYKQKRHVVKKRYDYKKESVKQYIKVSRKS